MPIGRKSEPVYWGRPSQRCIIRLADSSGLRRTWLRMVQKLWGASSRLDTIRTMMIRRFAVICGAIFALLWLVGPAEASATVTNQHPTLRAGQAGYLLQSAKEVIWIQLRYVSTGSTNVVGSALTTTALSVSRSGRPVTVHQSLMGIATGAHSVVLAIGSKWKTPRSMRATTEEIGLLTRSGLVLVTDRLGAIPLEFSLATTAEYQHALANSEAAWEQSN